MNLNPFKPSPKSNSPFVFLVVGYLLGAVSVATAYIWLRESPFHSHSQLSIPTYRARAASPATPEAPLVLDPAVARVAARFICICGTCGEKKLDVCTCETAQEERAFIQEQFRNGHSEEEAAEALKQKYGGLKI